MMKGLACMSGIHFTREENIHDHPYSKVIIINLFLEDRREIIMYLKQ